jgi:hypothetical protein
MTPSDRNSTPMRPKSVPNMAPRSSRSEAQPIISTSFCVFVLRSPSATLCVLSNPTPRGGSIRNSGLILHRSPGSPVMPLSPSASHNCPCSENTCRTSSHIIVVFRSVMSIYNSSRNTGSTMTNDTFSIDAASNAAPLGLNALDYFVPGACTPGWLDVASSRLSIAG